jgi:hypothetical protein
MIDVGTSADELVDNADMPPATRGENRSLPPDKLAVQIAYHERGRLRERLLGAGRVKSHYYLWSGLVCFGFFWVGSVFWVGFVLGRVSIFAQGVPFLTNHTFHPKNNNR